MSNDINIIGDCRPTYCIDEAMMVAGMKPVLIDDYIAIVNESRYGIIDIDNMPFPQRGRIGME